MSVPWRGRHVETPEGWGICVKEAEELEVGSLPKTRCFGRGGVKDVLSFFIADSNMMEMIFVAFDRIIFLQKYR